MPFAASVVTIFPEMFPGPLGQSLTGRALERGDWSLQAINPRSFTADRHQSVDDTPFGGGAGMVMRPDVIAAALDAAAPDGDERPRIYLTPRGRRFVQADARRLADGPGVVLLCGRYEGVDQRVIESRGLDEVSIGDFVLSGGELAAFLVLDSVVRLLPGVLGSASSLAEESFEDGLLEYPHYTRPAVWEGRSVPEILLSGHHGRIRDWRREQAKAVTLARRPDLIGAKNVELHLEGQ
ncbi:MAG TPA: tRNA (guanosine(37)-N1)-methyltransferase TrmD [Geminicoccus sp.]|jgi:tRNA (guanine37-N1)-methyltransferase|uniref:tRNA (guanosine(37)-N1)-methyltransferase TrmD n=1 Tax=Geminicoccus sp. TaxID=2024832 RepID=UPI002E32A79C|nr:tRNA (guanosine(37)-N1)-methyltransferase TrmD [Geminicoccus sp.]HEX2527797.1 tRNA (guanosine(37)-N1)-methyltransferase TrmD [Geminicoccus sp.]